MTRAITFFLVDDDEDDSLLFAEVVDECNTPVRFTAAQNGFEALEILRHQAVDLPDLIFLDLNMPRMDGRECLRELKADARLAPIPIIIYTTTSYLKEMEETIQLGAIGLISKPSNVNELKLILDVIAANCPDNLDYALHYLSTNVNTPILC